MPTVVTTNPSGMPSLLDLTSRVRREVTKESLTSLNSDAVNNVIVDALNDAVEDIYFRAKWSWAKVAGNLVMVTGQSEYTQPSDFYRMASEPEIGSIKLIEVDAEEWYRRTFTTGLTGVQTSLGQPILYMVDRALIKFWPTPSSDFVALAPTIRLLYYRRPSARLVIASDSAKAFDLPVEFNEAIVRFAVGKLKIFRQFDDFQLDMARYEEIISRQLYSDQKSVHPARVRPRNWASANYG